VCYARKHIAVFDVEGVLIPKNRFFSQAYGWLGQQRAPVNDDSWIGHYADSTALGSSCCNS
jgi:hypothetical protein